MKYAWLVAFIALTLCGCGDLDYQHRSLTAPSSPTSLQAWYPCVGVQTPGGIAYDIQMSALQKLRDAGRLEWVRFGVAPSQEPHDLRYHYRAKSMGLKIINVVQLHHLEKHGWHETFDDLYRSYPHDEDDIWGIAGEVTNPNPSVNPAGTMSPDVYLAKFKDLYDYVRATYPGERIWLSNGPTFGSGGGPSELQYYFDHGLLDMDVAISLNAYTDSAISMYGALLQDSRYRGKLRGKRIFVTETGDGLTGQGEHQISHVEDEYPRIRALINPEQACWYILWGGDGGGDTGFGLITGVEHGPYVERPLFQALTRGQE